MKAVAGRASRVVANEICAITMTRSNWLPIGTFLSCHYCFFTIFSYVNSESLLKKKLFAAAVVDDLRVLLASTVCGRRTMIKQF